MSYHTRTSIFCVKQYESFSNLWWWSFSNRIPQIQTLSLTYTLISLKPIPTGSMSRTQKAGPHWATPHPCANGYRDRHERKFCCHVATAICAFFFEDLASFFGKKKGNKPTFVTSIVVSCLLNVVSCIVKCRADILLIHSFPPVSHLFEYNYSFGCVIQLDSCCFWNFIGSQVSSFPRGTLWLVVRPMMPHRTTETGP